MSSKQPEKSGAPGTEALPHAQPPPVVSRFRLRVLEGPDQGAVRVSEGRSLVVGTHEGVDLLLGDRTVSRFHCEVSLHEGAPRVRDLGSRNGTRVDGVEVIAAPLRDGSVVAVGGSRLKFTLGPDTVPIALSERDRFGRLSGRSIAMRTAFLRLEQAASSDVTVLLEGETGTGKELAAASLHEESARRDGPFVIVDCASLPPTLAASELFGHVRGAYTGAVGDRPGAFESAEGGTIFLDEIGELGVELQPVLLRALERRETRRVGSERWRSLDVRVIAASHRDLRAEVNAGRFRADLFYRLAVLSVRIPPLRERTDDLPDLVERLLEDLGASQRAGAERLRSGSFLRHLASHRWPGNVRELRNYLERCLLVHETEPLEPGPAEPLGSVDSTRPFKLERERWLRTLERRYLSEVLHRHSGNVREAAKASGLDRIYFYRLLWRHGLR